jgi:small neutral amino acid transporter SnatA (MarC family)
MGRELSLFISTFATLLAIINPFEVLPIISNCWTGRMSKHIVAWLGNHAFTRCS